MKLLRSFLYWLFIFLGLIMIFAESYDSLGKSAYFVTLLFPVVYFTSYTFSEVLIPRYLLKEKYLLFAVYALCAMVVSIYLETWAIALAFTLVARYDYSHMIAATTDVFQLATTLYAIVLLNVVMKIFSTYRSREKLIDELSQPQPAAVPASISIMSQRKHRVIVLSDITYIESMADYVKVHLQSGEAVITKKKISHLEAELGTGFLRIHRSFIVNRVQVTGYTQEHVAIADTTLNISRKYKATTMEVLKSPGNPGFGQ